MAPQDGTTTDDEKARPVKVRFLVVFSPPEEVPLAPRIRIGAAMFP